MGQSTSLQSSPAAPASGLWRSGGASSTGRKLEDVCEVDRTKPLGKGSFGTVWRAKLKKSGLRAAVKALDKKQMREKNVPTKLVLAEVEFMRECSGKAWFVNLLDFVEAKGMFFIVMELCDGDLEGAAKECEGKLGEAKVVRMMLQMFEGIAFLHSRSICHRDIKPQNAMIVGRPGSDDVKVKLADFGIASRLKKGQLLTEKVGTPAFMAPEMHLLPGRSAGYDEKVDLWAAGAVVVFLLAFEYPFVDGSGRLLRNQLLRGDLPLWDADVFSGLFQRVQEAAGIRRKRPSKTARDLIRLLLNPKRQNRLSAQRALQHAWFKPGTDYSDRGDDLPLLEWSEIEEGISSIERELQRVAAGVADVAVGVADAAVGMAHVMGEVQIDPGCQRPLALDPADDRVSSCVVCYNSSGNLGYLCPQCHHSVCFTCLEKLPKAECPHCRNAASDVALTQQVAKFARSVTTEAGGLAAAASADLGKATAAIAVDVDVGNLAPRSEEARRRSATCHFCQAASSATSHLCPLCCACVCLACARQKLAKRPHCPGCGDSRRNAQEIRELLAAGEAWEQLSAVPGVLGAHASSLGARASVLVDNWATRASEVASKYASSPLDSGEGVLATRRASDAGIVGRRNPFDTDVGTEAAELPDAEAEAAGPPAPRRQVSQALLRRRLSEQAQLPLTHCCHFCGRESASLDLACPACSASVCSGCLREHLPEVNAGCPACQHPEFCNDRSLRLVLSAAHVRDSAQSLWHGLVDLGHELFAADGAAASQPLPRQQPSRALGAGGGGAGRGGLDGAHSAALAQGREEEEEDEPQILQEGHIGLLPQGRLLGRLGRPPKGELPAKEEEDQDENVASL